MNPSTPFFGLEIICANQKRTVTELRVIVIRGFFEVMRVANENFASLSRLAMEHYNMVV